MALRNRWLRLLVGGLAVAALLYCTRRVQLVVVAYGTYHTHVFTSPPREPGDTTISSFTATFQSFTSSEKGA